jgi:hypothetical protein
MPGVKRKATPLTRFAGLLPAKSAGGLRGLSTAHPWTDAKLAGIHAGHPAGFPPPTRRYRGAPGRATRLLRVLFRKARATAFSSSPSAGHEGPRLYRGPCAAVRRGRQAAQRESPGQATAWMPELRQRRSGCPKPCRKARPRLTDLPGRRPGKRQAGCSFSLLRASCPPPFGPASPFAPLLRRSGYLSL